MSVFKESFERVVSPIEYHQLLPYSNLYLEREGLSLVENVSTKTDINITKLDNPIRESFPQRGILLSQSDSGNSSPKKSRLNFQAGLLNMVESMNSHVISVLDSVIENLISVTSNLLPTTNYRDHYKSDVLVKLSRNTTIDKDDFVSQLVQSFNKELLEDGYFHHKGDILAQELSCKTTIDKDNFVSQLIQSFDKGLLEDGYFHPSQEIIAQGLVASHDSVSQWLLEIYNDNLKINPSLSASLLKSIGRFDFAEVYPWGFMIASLGILENSVEIRGAAVDCFENWGNEQSLEKLEAHVNQEQIPWLRDYISQVIVDISSEQKEMELEISGS